MTKYVVTGIAGFVGSAIAQALLEDPQNEVVGIDSFSDYYDVSLKRRSAEKLAASGARIIEGDINKVNLSNILDGADVVFHEAGQPGVRSSWGEEFSQYTNDNVLATQRMLEASRDAGVRRFVYASSSSVYGDAEAYPTSERDLPQPISPYGVTKLAAEHLVSLYGRSSSFSTVSLRYFTVYGPRQRPDMAFHRFLKHAIRGEQITVYGNGEQVREFTYVSDIVRANLLAGSVDLPSGTVINLSGGSSVSVNDVLGTISEILGTKLKVAYIERVAGDVARTGGSTDRAKELLGWSPQVDLRTGIIEELAWIRSIV